MNIPSRRAFRCGFTLVEMLTVMAIISILVALLLPALRSAKARARRIKCIANLKETGLAFHIFLHDHNGKFPMQVPISDGGTLEFVNNSYLIPNHFFFEYRHFQALSNDLVAPSLLLCPADIERSPADNFSNFSNTNISYFVGSTADYNVPDSILAGDRNLTNAAAGDATIIRLSDGTIVRWTRAMHVFKGNILYADGHVDELNSIGFKLASSGGNVTDLVLPTSSSSSVSSSGSNSPPSSPNPYPQYPRPPGWPSPHHPRGITVSGAAVYGTVPVQPSRSAPRVNGASPPSESTGGNPQPAYIAPSAPRPAVRPLTPTNSPSPKPAPQIAIEEPKPSVTVIPLDTSTPALAQVAMEPVNAGNHWLWLVLVLVAVAGVAEILRRRRNHQSTGK